MADAAVAAPPIDPKAAVAVAAADHILAATKADPDPAPADAAAAKPATDVPAAAPAAVPEPARKDAPVEAKPPEQYELTLPPDTPLDLATVTAQAQALELTPAQAQRYAQAQHEAVTKAFAQIQQDYADVQADPVIGGAQFPTTLKHVHTAMAYLFGDEVAAAQDVFTRFGLANNKVLVRGLWKLGKNLAEDTPINPGRADVTAKRPPEDVLYGKPST